MLTFLGFWLGIYNLLEGRCVTGIILILLAFAAR
jgi:hypothetical protein